MKNIKMRLVAMLASTFAIINCVRFPLFTFATKAYQIETISIQNELNAIRKGLSRFISENKLKADVVLEDKYGLNDLIIIIEVQPDLMIAGYVPELKTKLEEYIINNYSQEYKEKLVFAPTDLLEAHEKVKNYIAENNLNSKGIVCVDFEKYPEQFGRVVIETYDNYDHEAWLSVIDYIQNNINENNIYYLCRIVIQDDIIMTTANPNAENNNIKGDANGDGYVDISDAVLVKGYLLNCEKYSISSERISCADVSGDNDGINIIDALKIQQYVVGLIDTF